jgi:uncharacterized 2Fe-2S/4Fe-4S cluster protein (DUF4445 family)
MLIDVGTNGEIMFLDSTGLTATSCATGPAFEGASIQHGMQATSGAIDGIKIDPETWAVNYSMVQLNRSHAPKPAGICGTGVVSAVAELLRAGIISTDGAFNRDRNHPNLQTCENAMLEFILVSAEKTAHQRPIALTQKDIRAIQLAKGALLTGIELLCEEAGVERPGKILLAGAFGSYIDRQDVITIGMFPEMPMAAIQVVGNAAGAGAILALFDDDFLDKAHKLIQTTRVVELSAHSNFQDTFIGSLTFPEPL